MNILRPDILWRVFSRFTSRQWLRRTLPKFLGLLAQELRTPLDQHAGSGSIFQQHQIRMAALAARPGTGRLTGKVAIITGAASGLGRAIAILFAREGAKVVVADLNTTGGDETISKITALGGTGFFARTDVTSEASIQELVAQTKRTFHQVDILVNNAGANIEGGLLNLPPEKWQHSLNLNLTAAYQCCRFVVPEIIKTGGGSVIMMASVQGIAGFLESGAYAAAKGGLISLTRQLARQFANQRTRFNAISPGVVLTPIFDQTANREVVFQIVSDHTPLGFIGVPEDIAFASVFLASDESSYITGTNLVVDGGMTMRGV